MFYPIVFFKAKIALQFPTREQIFFAVKNQANWRGMVLTEIYQI